MFASFCTGAAVPSPERVLFVCIGASSHPSLSYMNSHQVWVHMWCILPFSRKDRLLAPTSPLSSHFNSNTVVIAILERRTMSEVLGLSWSSFHTPSSSAEHLLVIPSLVFHTCEVYSKLLSFLCCVFEFIWCHMWITSTFNHLSLASFVLSFLPINTNFF